MNVNDITQTVEVQGGTGKIRCLSWRQRQEARDEASHKSIKLIADMGGDVMKALRELDDGDTDAREARGIEDPLQGLDQAKVLQFGVMALHENGNPLAPSWAGLQDVPARLVDDNIILLAGYEDAAEWQRLDAEKAGNK